MAKKVEKKVVKKTAPIAIEYADEACSAMAYILTETTAADLYLKKALKGAKLDFSLESLLHVDKYLTAVHKKPPTEDYETMQFVMRTGLYVGEVIRQISKQTWHWLDYENAAKIDADIQESGQCVVLAYVLRRDDGALIFPLAKVWKFVENGDEDSVHFYAHALLSQE